MENVIDTAAPPAIEGGRAAFWNAERLDSILAEMGKFQAVGSTGLAGFDAMLGGGLMPGVFVLSGEPGAGKSSFALQLADYVAQFGSRRVLYASLEMSAPQLVAKSFTRLSATMDERAITFREIPALMRNLTNERDTRAQLLFRVIHRYADEIAGSISTQDAVMTISDIARLYDQLPVTDLPPLLVLDYIQLIGREDGDAGATDIQLLSATMRALCSLSKKYSIPIICLSSQNRGKRGTSILDSLAGCSELEYSASGVWFLSVDGKDADERKRNAERDPRPVSLTIAKNRFGILGTLPLHFFPAQSRFTERAEP